MLNEIQIQLNGQAKSVQSGINLLELLQCLDLKSGQVAIEVNREIIKKHHWKDVKLQSDDVVEIVHFVGGGES